MQVLKSNIEGRAGIYSRAHRWVGKRWGWAVFLGLIGLTYGGTGAEFFVEAPGVDENGRFRLQLAGEDGSYAVLYRGVTLDAISVPVALSAATEGVVTLADPEVVGFTDRRFYRVERLLSLFPADLDRDGIHDGIELRHPTALNPLNPGDASLDFDLDGRSNLDEALAGTNPTLADFSLTRVSSLPAHGEAGVSVNREVIWRFSAALAPNTSLGTNVLFAHLGTRRLLTRNQLSADRQRATLFFLEPVPAGARIQVRLDGSQLSDIHGSQVDGDGDGLPGGWAEMRYDTMSSAPVPGTGVSGYVYDSEMEIGPNGLRNKALAGVVITVDGHEQELRAETDESGFFLLSPCPVGRFFVHIDGRPAIGSDWPSGAYYPFVGKTFEATAGHTNARPGGSTAIYLPKVAAGALQPVSAVADTTIEFPASVIAARPELAGVQVTVPANALYADNGARGGRVGIAPVPRDRLPSPLPPGLEPPIVITVQSDGGSNFDAPVPVRFPNVPDPVTGRRPGPGDKTTLWSFNHDSGKWESQGSMTISADGQFAVSDPGVGILQPGWQGALAVGQPAPAPSGCGLSQGLQIAKEYIEWQLKQMECAGKALLLLGTGPLGGRAIRGVGALAQAGGNLNGIVSGLQGMAAGVQSGQGAGALGSSFAVITGLKNSMAALLNVVNPATAFSQVQDLGVCLLEMAKEQLDFICPATACVLGPNTPNLSTQQAACNGMRSALTSALNAISAYQFAGAGSLGRLLIAMDKLGPLLQSLGSNAPVPGARSLQPTQSPEVLRAEILATIQEALDAAHALQRELQPTMELAASVGGFQSAYSNYLARVDGPMLFRLSAHENAWFALTSGGVTTRGRSSALGTFELPFVNVYEPYSFSVYDPRRNTVSDVQAPAPGFGGLPIIPDPVLRIPGVNDLSGDGDGDGLTDLAESVLGTRPDSRDSDGDGATDWTEVQEGQNPLDGIAFPIGPVAALELPGVAQGIDISDSTGFLALGTAGVGVVDLSDPIRPILLGTVGLPGESHSLASSTTAKTLGVIAYAPNDQIARGELSQLHFLNVSDVANPRPIRTLRLPARFIQERDGLFYVAVNNDLRIYDASSGLEVGWLAADGFINGLLVTPSEIFVTTGNQLAIYDRQLSDAPQRGRVNGDFAAAEVTLPVPMVQEGDILWMGTASGLIALDISNRAQPRVLNQTGVFPRAVRTLGLTAARQAVGLTTVGPNAVNAGGQTTIYNVTDPAATNRLALVLNARGRTYDSALLSGWVILADGQAGLTVMNVLSPDSAGVPPTLTWDSAAVDVDRTQNGIQVPEGAELHLHPQVSDDVDMVSVELLLDGEVAAIARTVPPELSVQMPLRAATRDRVRVAFRTRDRGGNVTETDPTDLVLVEDSTPAAIDVPVAGVSLAVFNNAPVVLHFTESLRPENLTPEMMSLLNVGADGIPGGGDDTAVPVDSIQVVGASVLVWPAASLAAGRYLLTIPSNGIRDLAGNPLPGDLMVNLVAVDAGAGAAVWMSSTPGRFQDPTRWNTRRVPVQEDVVIALPGGNPLVTVDSGVVVRSLLANGSLALTRFGSLTVRDHGRVDGELMLDGGGLTVMSGGSLITGLNATGGSVSVAGRLETRGRATLRSGASVTLQGPEAAWIRPGGLEARDITLVVRDGAVAEFGEFVDYMSDGDFSGLFPVGTRFEAQGSEARLRLPNLLTARGPEATSFTGAPSLILSASNGGVLELPRLNGLARRVQIQADGAGRVDAPQLTRLEGPSSAAFPAGISCNGAGEVNAPLLAVTTACNVQMGSSGRLRCATLGIGEGFTLKGTGVIAGDVVCGGGLQPGEPGGVLRVEGHLTLEGTAVFSPVVGSSFGPGSVQVLQTAELAGLLKPQAARGAVFNAGDVFEVAVFEGTVSGSFVGLDATGIRSGAVIEAVPEPDRVRVRVVTP